MVSVETFPVFIYPSAPINLFEKFQLLKSKETDHFLYSISSSFNYQLTPSTLGVWSSDYHDLLSEWPNLALFSDQLKLQVFSLLLPPFA